MKSVHRIKAFTTVAALGLTLTSNMTTASEKSLTLCWAAWDPANALVELSKGFTQESGIKMNFEFVPWTSFASRFQNELNSRGELCDLLIGDSQWIGGSAENGHYVKLNEFFDKEGIKMDHFIPATVEAYSTWPKGTKNYWALPAMGDALGWVYRKDWFAREDIRAEFKSKYQRELSPPKTWTELKQVASFFQGREIDGQKVYGAAIYTERGSEGITMGATSALYAHGFEYQNPSKPYDIEGYVNSANAVQGLEAYKDLYNCCTPPGHSNAYMVANLDAYKSGQVAMQMNWFAFFPGIVKDPEVGGEKSGFFLNPMETSSGSTLGGQGISVVSYSKKQDLALEYIKWFAQPAVQSDWWSLGGYSAHRSVVEDPNFKNTAPFALDFVKAMSDVKDFWQEPNYAELLQSMQKRLHDYVVADKGTAEQALEKLKEDWIEIFEDGGQL
ncbi:ABC transporter substrate-binding protein [Vibrio nigripulchritudo]|uniref:ABC transporter substrate-binding protein n=1 Tax=Vibrio nigripulchritudo TaxID=28173 RepID=UPI0024920E7B|nr:ABC transporter substrate-binding protein [Vibrio nigripulchritudo]BDU37942.1 ABC transporter substrate-binding protein [Vibrio nigripulchritudo]BDU43664.1 ABC transporter substrate-binding protein [Vibrio nigripulchritudo]